MTNTVLAALPISREFDNSSVMLGGGQLFTYQAGSTTPLATYQDLAGTIPNSNPVVLDTTGRAIVRYQAGVAYKLVLTDNASPPNTLWTLDNYYPPLTDLTSLGATQLGTLLWPVTAAETTAGITPLTNYPYSDIRRYGVVPNSSSAAAANTAAAQQLFNYSTVGPTGTFVFPNTTGSDIYYFNNSITVRGFCYLDLGGSTLNYAGTVTSANVNTGLFNFYNDFAIGNGSITCAVNCTGATGCGLAIFVGGRDTSGPVPIFDSLLASGKSLGRGRIHDLVITMANTGTAPEGAIEALGGISNLTVENVTIDCGSSVTYGFIYEFGWATNEVAEASRQTSHAKNMAFRNIRVINAATGGAALALGGAYNSIVDGLYANGCPTAFDFYVGEALFYRPWAGSDDQGVKRDITLRNIIGEACTSTAIQLTGASLASGGYLAATIAALGHPADYAAQTGLMHFSLDGFSIGGSGVGISVSGSCDIRNGLINTTASSGSFIISDECIRFSIDNVTVRDNTNGVGIRANFGDAIWSPSRLKIGTIANCTISGNKTQGIQLGNTAAVTIRNCKIGYNTIWDVVNETTQTSGIVVLVGSSGSIASAGGVTCDNNNVTAPTASYTITGTPALTNELRMPRGAITGSLTGWAINGSVMCTATQLADKTAAVNVYDKLAGSKAYTTSDKKLWVAQGPAVTDQWELVDGSASVTPA